jgi:hypothetical protein
VPGLRREVVGYGGEDELNNPETLTERLRRHSQTVDLAGYHAVATDVLEAADTIDTLTTRLREVEEANERLRKGLRAVVGASLDQLVRDIANTALSTERTP